jgi:hypothetical protein
MINLFGVLLSAMFFLASSNASDLDVVRANYNKVASDKKLCKVMISELEKTKDNSATHLAYLGASQTIWANHVFSPISKLNTFKLGKENIEKAIETEPDNVELRFIRLSIQKNAPGFLGYKSNLKEDTEFIQENRNQIESEIVQQNIETLFKN